MKGIRIKMDERPMLKKIFEEIQDGRNIDDIIRFTDDFEKLMSYYWCALCEVETKFKVLDNQLSLGKKRNPIESIKTRLKSVQSIQGKLNKLGLEFNCDAIEKNLSDVAGIRVICSYIDDIYMLAECLLKQDDVKLIQWKDYIKEPKKNGYRSLHLIIEIPIFLANEKKMVRAEVQLRTIAMESWANLEHRMRYKKALSADVEKKVSQMLSSCADMSLQLDVQMQEIRDLVYQENE